MSTKLRVGIIGRTKKGNYGHWLDTVWKHVPGVEVVSIADEDPTGRIATQTLTGAATSHADFREMLAKERLDIATICPRWIDQHRDMMVAAAAHGCHMFVEKPFCRSLTEADEVVRACEQRQLKLAIAHQSHYSSSLTNLLGMIKAGEIGEILELRGRGKDDRRGGGEDLWVLGCHVMDLMRFIGGDPLDCYATVTVNGKRATKADVAEGKEGIGPLAGDHIQARYTFPNGVTGFYASRRNMGTEPSRFGVQVFGSKGAAEVLFGFPAACFILRDPSWSPGRSQGRWLSVPSDPADKMETLRLPEVEAGNVAIASDLLQSIKDNRQPRCNMYDARWTIEMISAVFESHRVRETVTLPLKQRLNPCTLFTNEQV